MNGRTFLFLKKLFGIRKKILFIGGAGMGNVGDEMLLLSAIQSLKNVVPEVDIIVATPNETISKNTLSVLAADISYVSAPRLCVFRTDQDSHYWNCDQVFFERWHHFTDHIAGNSAKKVLTKLHEEKNLNFCEQEKTLSLLQAIYTSDAVVFYGGGILTSATRSRLWDMALVARICCAWKKTVLMRSHQVGPIDNQEDAIRLREVLKASKRSTVRDKDESVLVCVNNLPGSNVKECVDDAYMAELPISVDSLDIFAAQGIQKKAYIAVAYRTNHSVGVTDEFEKVFATVLEWAKQVHDLPIVLVPLTPADVSCLKRLQGLIDFPVTIVQLGNYCWDAVKVFENAKFIISLPHHSLIFGLRKKIPILSPVIGHYYTHKNKSSMRFFGLEHRVIPYEGNFVSFEKQIKSILLDWKYNCEADVALIDQVTKNLKENYRITDKWFWEPVG